MPFNLANLAVTTNHDNGGALHCLIPTIIKNLVAQKPGLEKASAELVKAFNEHYQTHISQSQLLMAARMVHNPVNRELLLAPVLRTMLPSRNSSGSLEGAEILYLANKFGIKIETYTSEDLNTNLSRSINQSAAGEAALTLRLRRDGLNLWDYEEESAEAAVLHNAFYLERDDAAIKRIFANITNNNFFNMKSDLEAVEKERLERVKKNQPKPNINSAPNLEETAKNLFSGIILLLQNTVNTFMKAMQPFFAELLNLFSGVLPKVVSTGENLVKEIPKLVPLVFSEPTSPKFEVAEPARTFLPMFNQFVKGMQSMMEIIRSTVENPSPPKLEKGKSPKNVS
jgi:hypothetical protein